MQDALAAALSETICAHSDRVQDWIENRPGAWGYLAGQAVLACRRSLGRSLTDPERRMVWQALWQRLQECRQ